MAELDFHPSKAEQQNVGKTTDNALSNAQSEINSDRTLPNSSKAEIASQTEAMTKGDRPVLPAFDMSRFGDEQSKDNNPSTSSGLNSSDSSINHSKNMDTTEEGKTGPTSTDANNCSQGAKDGGSKPTSAVQTRAGSDNASTAAGSDKVDFTPPSSTGNVTSAGSQTSAGQ